MGFLEFIFGVKRRKVDSYLEKNALVLDVRTQREWNKGYIENSIHIPLNELDNRINEVKALDKLIITCCESGVRSAKAAKFLNLNTIEATNGGGWRGLNKKILS